MPQPKLRLCAVQTIFASMLCAVLAATAINCGSAPITDPPATQPIIAKTDTGAKIQIGGGTLDILIPQPLAVSNDAAIDWARRAAVAITDFYGRYPVKHVTITITPADSGAVQNGYETAGRQIHIQLGGQTQLADLQDDWMITHEMFHLSQPGLPDDFTYMSEGMADYLEPVARVRIGQIGPDEFWRDLIRGMPQGLPQPGDGGLDGTKDWGRIYWGGCLFWLMVDIRIHQQTQNQKSILDAAKAALDAGGDGSQLWSIDRLLTTYDSGTGTRVFQQLHEEMGAKPDAVDLPALWKSLGISDHHGQIQYDDTAPLAGVRKAITASIKGVGSL